MKIDWNRKYTTIAVYAVIVICLGVSFYLSVTKFAKLSELTNTFLSIIKPFILGFALAYLLNFVMDFYERKIFKNNHNLKQKPKRFLSILLTYISLSVVILLFLKFVLPQVADSISILVKDFPNLVNQLYSHTDSFINEIDLTDASRAAVNQQINIIGKKAINFATNFVPYFANFFINIVMSIWNMVLGLIISIYILADKEGFYALCKKFISAVFTDEKTERILYITRLSNEILGKFIVGKIVDSVIIAFITFIILSITNMPYKILLTFIIGITNIIPFFGPFIGAIPSILIVLLVDPIKALWLAVIIFFIQQLDGNIIGPKILGGSIGISSFWILFSLLLAGKFFGIIGMIFGVPIFAIIHTIVGESINAKLIKKGLPTDKNEYINK
ncbi:AI-2E family transporter [Peptostreptococcus canis]|uniref:AI-2E family transporter n=1 Tax=Peptostreptococcus canis TaxID=1159213 RepID=A0ABR6TKB8_9FIRM|nr:AI-2E family transporter [Peptostreptococcus canis]MBC2575852.1 AI-2E family transporter [Peptostreptococcus canis]MBP1998029.1 putative PurR-regulated permease PerM [Peptostreptococcus canis]